MPEGRCSYCSNIRECTVCGSSVESFRHVGVRASGQNHSAIWHYAYPCGHRNEIESSRAAGAQPGTKLAVYNGGPVWKDGYQWVNIFWGAYWTNQPWVQFIDRSVADIEKNQSYSGGLKQYNVGIGSLKSHVIIQQDPPSTVSNQDIGGSIVSWIKAGTVPDLAGKGAYNVFLPPGITATLGPDASCSVFCDYHDTGNGNNGPFFTCEPYPCSTGCNQCTSSAFDTMTQGLSEEMVELKTDMNPGTGWVIGNEEICDYCDAHFVCNRISTGEYVNAWYSDAAGACWKP